MTDQYSYKVYPPINIARVGNSAEYYIGPEETAGLPLDPVTGQPVDPTNPLAFRDSKGAIKRQAARFKVFQIDEASGEATELTLNSANVTKIEWSVRMANKKPTWYDFQTGAGEHGYASNHPVRNPNLTDAQRALMILDSGQKSISGASQGPLGMPVTPLDPLTGNKATLYREEDKEVEINKLGDLITDSEGRLLVLGGHGHSGTTDKSPDIKTYANNSNWWDDTSDGPIFATITFSDGTSVEADPGWYLCTPPAFAPEILNLVTLYDTIFDVAVRKQGLRPDIFTSQIWNKGADGYLPCFETEIKPLIMRGFNYADVVAIPRKPHKFPVDMLGNPSQEIAGMRQYILEVLRGPRETNNLINSQGVTMMPYLAGDDAVSDGNDGLLTSKYLRLTDTQYFMLQQWADGHFVTKREQTEDEPYRLTKAVLDNCVGGAFSPGIEMTWISRIVGIYSEPFRIDAKRHLPEKLNLGLKDFATIDRGVIDHFVEELEQSLQEHIDSSVLRVLRNKIIGLLHRIVKAGTPASSMELGVIVMKTLYDLAAQNPGEHVNKVVDQVIAKHEDALFGGTVEPGDVTKLMAMPWQADYNECSAQNPGDRTVWWWPAQRPSFVHLGIKEADKTKKMQVTWIGQDYDINGNGFISFPNDLGMVNHWHGLGFIAKVPYKDDKKAFLEVARNLKRKLPDGATNLYEYTPPEG